ncbi:MAG: TetR/AcrR family transcriptional regulator [Paracoccaceae bacterium]
MSSKISPARERILKSTWALLERGDGGEVRMSDIAKAANVSRQALYLHFENRAELLVATTRYLDEIHNIEDKLRASRSATSGIERLNRWIEFWGNYIPTIYGAARALLAMKDTDEAALIAWNDRMQAVRDGCAAAVTALDSEGRLTPGLNAKEATDLLWTLQSVHSWEKLVKECRWSQVQYIEQLKRVAAQVLVRSEC